jgi:hypothetical protein
MAGIPPEQALRTREEPFKNPLMPIGSGAGGTAVRRRLVK